MKLEEMQTDELGWYWADDVEDLYAEVEHLREYTDHLVSFSKLPCLPKDLENLREANTKLAVENEELKKELDFYKKQFKKYVEAASIFQCGGKYHKRADLPLGACTIVEGIIWADREIQRLDEDLKTANEGWDRALDSNELLTDELEEAELLIASLEQEIVGWKNKCECAVEMAAQAEFKFSQSSKYTPLKEGDIIQHDDEFLNDNDKYEPVSKSCLCQSGYPIGFPYRENFHSPMRRKVN